MKDKSRDPQLERQLMIEQKAKKVADAVLGDQEFIAAIIAGVQAPASELVDVRKLKYKKDA